MTDEYEFGGGTWFDVRGCGEAVEDLIKSRDRPKNAKRIETTSLAEIG